MKKIRFLTHMPLIAGFGGLERQAQGYMRALSRKYDAGFLKRDEEAFDVLHIVGHRFSLNQYFFTNLKKKGVKIVYSPVFYIRPVGFMDFRNPYVFKILTKLPYTQFRTWKTLRDNADLILPNSESEKKQLMTIFGKPAGKIEVIYNQASKLNVTLVDKSVLKKRNLQVGKYFVSISHIEPRKNTLNLIKAFLKFSKNDSKWKLVLIGKFRGSFGSFFRQVKSLIDKHSKKIVYIDGLEHGSKEFISLLSFSRAHLLPSFLETPGLSSLEAASLGIPILIGNDDPVKEVFGSRGISVNPYSLSSIIEGIKTVSKFSHSKKMANRVNNKYSQEVIEARLLDLYESEF